MSVTVTVVMVLIAVSKCAITPKDHITVYVLLVTNSGMTVSHVKVRLSIVAHACAFIFSYIHANL